MMNMAADATTKAEQLAQAEGLTLLRSNNSSGYLGVVYQNKMFKARATRNGDDIIIGSYATAAEAALAYARTIGPVRCAQEARKAPRKTRAAPTEPQYAGYGVPTPRVLNQRGRRLPAGEVGAEEWFETQENEVDEVTAVEVTAVVDAREEEYGDADTPASAPMTMQEPHQRTAVHQPVNDVVGMHLPRSSTSVSSSGSSIKRRRTAHVDEYEFTMPPSTRELTVPVPEGAVRAVCSITFHFA